ncbi:hypothetical protein JTE90_001215 [Oedothorax gibbosus]|uniref:Tetratricopeptide repeat protein 37 n=1 Tax=Oedothorax gibbosus TaxID=931172 RepID=A0AAV6UWF7_9ARAC|nr:hypothetical protein JTE90_001215 [Oedothorax gibbosus]
MDAKEIKSNLKQAREALKEKDYKTALKHCKTVLKSDKGNYNAWVFVGAAAQEVDQAEQSEEAFRKAIEISPEQILAWQGLCSFYEKHDNEDNIPKLITVYKKLLDLFSSEKDKKLEIYDKLIALLKRLNDKESVFRVLKSKLEVLKGDTEEEFKLQKQIFQEFYGQTKLSDIEKQMLSEALQTIVSHGSFTEDDCKRIFSTCIEPIFKAGAEDFSLSLANPIYEKFPKNVSCLEFFCRVAMNLYIDNGTIREDVEVISQSLSQLDIKTGLHFIYQGFFEFTSKNYIDAIHNLKQGLKTIEYCVQGWYFLSKSQLFLHQYTESEKSLKIGIDIALKSKSSSIITGKFYLLLGQVLSKKENWEAALKSLEKSATYLGQSKDLLIQFCFTLLKIGHISKAEQMRQDLKDKFADDPEVLQLEGFLYLSKEQWNEALQKLRLSVSKAESPFTLHLIGLVLWQSEQREKAFKVFIKAAELDPYFAKNYVFLGHYYLNHLFDQSKACLCYQRAFDLDNSDTEVGMSYSKLLKDMGNEEENIKVLQIITENANLGSCKWAWTQLGLSQLQKKLFSEAIFSFQNALRADPSSSYLWECLADAYLNRGSYESSYKAFEKVSELNPKAMYPLYQIATIQKMRGFFDESIEMYKNLLSIMSTYVPALIGMAETLILCAKKALEECMYGTVRASCQEALNTLAKVAASKPGLACLWKLAGDASTLPFHLDDCYFPFTIPFELHQQSDKQDLVCNKSEFLCFGSKFYGRALQLKEDMSPLWHDLGINCYFQSTLGQNEDEKLNLAKKAFICLQKAVSISPNYENHWTALGVVASSKELKDYAFGQHAFIKSLEINRINAETWSNLGVLYLENENLQLAHKAFTVAQSSEPTYPLSWVGLAFIAESIKHTETIDLYRHATTIGSHNEALNGYSRVVCDALLNTASKESNSHYKDNIIEMNATMFACDCSIKHTANNSECAEAFNMAGILQEREGLYSASLKSFKRALDLLEKSHQEELIEMVRANYARLLSIVGQSSEATKEYLLLKKVDVSIICCFALALYRDKEYEQSLKLFGQAFEKCKITSDKSHIKVAMAIVASKMSGQNVPNPKALLFESAQIQPPSVPGLLALYANGILEEDAKLISAARIALQRYKYLNEYSSSAALLWAAQAFITKGVQSARNELLKFNLCSPSNAGMWLQTATCLLQWDTLYIRSVLDCTKLGLFHEGCKERASQIHALGQMAKGSRRGGLSAAQKAVHINPGKLTNWATLAAACHVADLDPKHVGWMFTFVRKLAKEQGVNANFLGWFIVMEIFHYINSGNLSGAAALTKQALSVSSFTAETQSCLHILDAVIKVFSDNGNLEPLLVAVKNNPKSFFGWNVLSQFLLVSGNSGEAEKIILHFATTVEKMFPRWKIYPLLQFAVLAYKSMHANTDEHEKWLKVGEEMCGKAVHIAPTSLSARFLLGLFALESGNTSLAKRSFDKVFEEESERISVSKILKMYY